MGMAGGSKSSTGDELGSRIVQTEAAGTLGGRTGATDRGRRDGRKGADKFRRGDEQFWRLDGDGGQWRFAVMF